MADVARAAGVSAGTVSRAMSGNKGVSEHTRRRIRQLAESLGYVVSPEASGLAGGRTGRVGLITPVVDTWFYSTMIAGIAQELTAAGVDVLLYPLGSSRDRHHFFDELPARRKVDAIVVIAFPVTEEEWRRLDAMRVHVVVAGYVMPGRPSVGINDELAARHAVNHLIALGHRRIAMITSEDREGYHYAADIARERGYRLAHAEAGLPILDELVVSTEWGIDGGARAMDSLLSLSELPTAVFAYSDEVAFGAQRSLRRAGIRTPEDMSLIGIDDHPMASPTDLTTVHQSVMEQGAIAGQLCLKLLNDQETTQQVTLPTHLIVRRSTSPPSDSPHAQPATNTERTKVRTARP